MKAALTVLLVAVDPLMGGLAGYAEAFSELGDRIVAQSVIFEESLSPFAHGNTSPGHGRYLLAWKCYPCLQTICYLCPGTVHPEKTLKPNCIF